MNLFTLLRKGSSGTVGIPCVTGTPLLNHISTSLLLGAILVGFFSAALTACTSNRSTPSAQTLTSRLTPKATTASGATWYVSKSGDNSAGTSWASAWNELNQVEWNKVQPGDTLLLDGGATEMTYTTTLSIQKSGTAEAPITIERASEAGHNGTVIFFGGNTVPLPYCGQTSWAESAQTVGDALDLNGQSYITITGQSWNGIQIHGYTYHGVYFAGGESHVTMRDLEIYDNGNALLSGGVYYSNFPGVGFLGTQSFLTFDHMNIHDNGQDNFQSGGSFNNLLIENSWLHYTRTMPGVPSQAYNLCTHNDGLQIFGNQTSSNLTFQHTIFGPGLTNGLIFQPKVTNITIADDLFLDPGGNVTVENDDTSTNWHIKNITAIAQGVNLALEGSGNVVEKSIFYDGYLLLNNSVSASAQNCYWRTNLTGTDLVGVNADPQFVTDLSQYPAHTTDITQYPALTLLQNGNFTVSTSSACRGLGSSIPSVNAFLASVGG